MDKVYRLEPPIILTRDQLEEMMDASHQNMGEGRSGASILFAYHPESGYVLEGDADIAAEDKEDTGVWITPAGDRDHGP